MAMILYRERNLGGYWAIPLTDENYMSQLIQLG